MSSEAWSRALMEIGGGLENLAGHQANKEREQARAMREESMLRLRLKHDKELAGQRDKTQRELHAESEAGATARAEAANTTRRELASEANEFQSHRLNQQELARLDGASAANIKQIDMRIAELQDQISEANFGAAENMTEVDQATVSQIEAQIEYMAGQKKLARLTALMQKQAMNDPSLKGLSEDQLAIKAGYTAAEVKAAREAMEGKKPEAEPTTSLMPEEEAPRLDATAGAKLLDEPEQSVFLVFAKRSWTTTTRTRTHPTT